MLIRPVSFSAGADFMDKVNAEQIYKRQEAPVPSVRLEAERPKKKGSLLKKTAIALAGTAVIAGTLAYGSQNLWFKLKNNGEGFADKIRKNLQTAGDWIYKKYDASAVWLKGLFKSHTQDTVDAQNQLEAKVNS